MSCNKLLLDYLATLTLCVLPADRGFASMVNCLSTVLYLPSYFHILGTPRTWNQGLGTNCLVGKTARFETVMFEHVLFATARFETVICESGLFDSVMFETVWWARVDVIMNTPLEQLGWVATWNLSRH